MIRAWLIKHWWVNESGKLLCAVFFGVVSYSLYVGEQRELIFLSGILFVACMCLFIDFATVIIRKIMGKPIYESE